MNAFANSGKGCGENLMAGLGQDLSNPLPLPSSTICSWDENIDSHFSSVSFLIICRHLTLRSTAWINNAAPAAGCTSNRLTRGGGYDVFMRVSCCLQMWCDTTHHGGQIAVDLCSGLVWSHGAVLNNTISIAREYREFNRDWENFRTIARNLEGRNTALDNSRPYNTSGHAEAWDG